MRMPSADHRTTFSPNHSTFKRDEEGGRVSADQIFVLLLVVGIVLGLAWLSINSRRRAELERQRQAEIAAAAAAELPAEEVREPARPERRQRRKR
jgi:hypothetical protein